jgi:beta-lactamase regulating signal transducer with metallopeptidase domain
MTSFIVSLAISLAARLTVLMIAGALAAFAFRRSSYAVRHLIIVVTLACAIALPPLMILMPEWRVGILPAEMSTVPDAAPTPVRTHIKSRIPDSSAPAPVKVHEMPQSIRPVLVTSALDIDASPARTASLRVPFTPSVPQLGFGIWMLGVLFGLTWLAAGQLGLARVRRHATPLRSIDWRALLELERMHAGVAADVALLSSPRVSTPVTWGIFKPVIVLPESAREWTEERKRVVVRHEMAHIARRDAATQLAATLASVIYWIHPLVIVATQRLRAECERACDERVLEMGTPATDYAAHLLDVAKLARSFGAANIVSVAMARPSQLEGRLLAVLHAEPSHTRVSARSRAVAFVATAMMLVAISAFKPVERKAQARADTSIVIAVPASPAAPAAPATPALPAPPSTPSISIARSAPSTPASPGAPAAPATPASPSAAATPSAPPAPASPAAPAAAHAVPAAPASPASPAFPAFPSSPAAPAAPAPFPTMSMFATVVSLPKVAIAFPGLDRALNLDTIVTLKEGILSQRLTDSVFERTVPAHDGGTLELDLDTGGEIDIIGTDDQKVSVRGTLGGTDWHETTVALEERGGDATLVTRYVGSRGEQSFDNRFSIRVPKRFNVRVQSAGGGVHITNVDGSFSGSTGGGKIAIEGAKGEAHLSTGGGDVRVTKSNLDGSVSTGGGTVRFEGVTGDIVGSSGSDPFHGAAPGAFSYKMKMPKGSSYSWTPGMDAETFKQTQKALEASQDAMRRAQEIMSDSDMQRMNRQMERARIQMDRERVRMDTMRIRMERHRWRADSSSDDSDDSDDFDDDTTVHQRRKEIIRYRTPDDDDSAVHERRNEIIRYRTPGEHHSSTMSKNGFIVIDKDGGSIELEDAPKGARVTTGGGAIVIGKSKGDVRAQTGGGDIDLGPIEGGADATTGAGDVSINLVGERLHPVNIMTGKGNVELVLPKDANATLDLETAYTQNFGRRTKIKGDWKLNVTETDDWDDSQGTPRKYVRVRQEIGSGGPVIRIRTVNGDITIKRG